MSRKGWLLFLALCVIWGIPYLLIRVAVRELSPPELVFFRTAPAALLLAPLALRRGGCELIASKGKNCAGGESSFRSKLSKSLLPKAATSTRRS